MSKRIHRPFFLSRNLYHIEFWSASGVKTFSFLRSSSFFFGKLKLISDEAEYIASHYPKANVEWHCAGCCRDRFRWLITFFLRFLDTFYAHGGLLCFSELPQPPFFFHFKRIKLEWGWSFVGNWFFFFLQREMKIHIDMQMYTGIDTSQQSLRLSVLVCLHSIHPSIHFDSVNGNKFRFITLLCSKLFMLMDEIINF